MRNATRSGTGTLLPFTNPVKQKSAQSLRASKQPVHHCDTVSQRCAPAKPPRPIPPPPALPPAVAIPPNLFRALNRVEEHNHHVAGVVALLRAQLLDLSGDKPYGLTREEAMSIHTVLEDMHQRSVELQEAVYHGWQQDYDGTTPARA